MQFKGEHFLQPWRAALDNKACDQAALSYLSLDHSLKVGAPPAPWLWSCPAQRAPPQGRLGVLCAKGVNRQEFPGSRLAPFLIASLSPIAQESAQAGSRTRGGGARGRLCLNYHSLPPPCFTPEIKELHIYWLVGTNKLPIFHFSLTKRKSPAHQTPHLEEIKPALGPQLA